MSLGCYATRKEALEALAEWQTNHLRVDLRNLTVGDVWKKVKPTVKQSMVRNYETVYRKYAMLQHTRLVDVKACTINEIPLPPLSKGSHNQIKAFWHSLFQWGIQNDMLNKDYSQYIRFTETLPSRKKEIFAPEEIREFLSIPLYKFLLYTGMRINELLTMKTQDVYKEDGILCFHVLESKTEAGKRIIPVHSQLKCDLDLSQEYVIEPHRPYYKVRAEFKELTLSDHKLHDFRRTFASYAKAGGADEYYTKCLLGHVHNDITEDIYTQAFIPDLKREIEKVRYL